MSVKCTFFSIIIMKLFYFTTFGQELTVGRKIYSSSDSAIYLIDKERLNYYGGYLLDGSLFEFVRSKRSKLIAYKDRVPVDTLENEKYSIFNYSGENFFVTSEGFLIIGHGEQDTLGIYSFDKTRNKFSLKFSEYDFSTFDLIGGHFWGYYHTLEKGKGLFKLNVSNFKITKAIDFKPFISEQSGITEIFNYGSGSKILVKTGESNADGFDDVKFFIYDVEDNSVSEVTEKFKKFCWLQNENNTFMQVMDNYSGILSSYMLVFGDGCVKQSRPPFLINEDIEVVEESIIAVNPPNGMIYNGEEFVGIFVNSMLDQKKSVIVKIPKIPSLELSLLLKKIYSDIPLIEIDLENTSKYCLNILKNFIYAKHNYKFTDLYWEAYLNQYDFYSDFFFKKKMERLPDVAGLLTSNDEISLALIEKNLSKR